MAATPEDTSEVRERQRRIRRTVWSLVALVLFFYVGFIVMSVSAARG